MDMLEDGMLTPRDENLITVACRQILRGNENKKGFVDVADYALELVAEEGDIDAIALWASRQFESDKDNPLTQKILEIEKKENSNDNRDWRNQFLLASYYYKRGTLLYGEEINEKIKKINDINKCITNMSNKEVFWGLNDKVNELQQELLNYDYVAHLYATCALLKDDIEKTNDVLLKEKYLELVQGVGQVFFPVTEKDVRSVKKQLDRAYRQNPKDAGVKYARCKHMYFFGESSIEKHKGYKGIKQLANRPLLEVVNSHDPLTDRIK